MKIASKGVHMTNYAMVWGPTYHAQVGRGNGIVRICGVLEARHCLDGVHTYHRNLFAKHAAVRIAKTTG